MQRCRGAKRRRSTCQLRQTSKNQSGSKRSGVFRHPLAVVRQRFSRDGKKEIFGADSAAKGMNVQCPSHPMCDGNHLPKRIEALRNLLRHHFDGSKLVEVGCLSKEIETSLNNFELRGNTISVCIFRLPGQPFFAGYRVSR